MINTIYTPESLELCTGRADLGARNFEVVFGLGLKHMGGCQNYGPFLSALNIRCRTILGTKKGP